MGVESRWQRRSELKLACGMDKGDEKKFVG